MENFEVEILNKIDKGEKLTEQEIKELTWNYEIERKEGGDRRWSRSITSYVELGTRYLKINWERGLTECQENEYYNQPVEVLKHEYDKVIPEHKEHIVEWVEKP